MNKEVKKVAIIVVMAAIGILLLLEIIPNHYEAALEEKDFTKTAEGLLLTEFVNAVNNEDVGTIAELYSENYFRMENAQMRLAAGDYNGITRLKYEIIDIVPLDSGGVEVYTHFTYRKDLEDRSEIKIVYMDTDRSESVEESDDESESAQPKLKLLKWITFDSKPIYNNYGEIVEPLDSLSKGINDRDSDLIREAYYPGSTNRDEIDELFNMVTCLNIYPSWDDIRIMTGPERVEHIPYNHTNDYVEYYGVKANIEYMLTGSSIMHSGETEFILAKYQQHRYCLTEWYTLPVVNNDYMYVTTNVERDIVPVLLVALKENDYEKFASICYGSEKKKRQMYEVLEEHFGVEDLSCYAKFVSLWDDEDIKAEDLEEESSIGDAYRAYCQLNFSSEGVFIYRYCKIIQIHDKWYLAGWDAPVQIDEEGNIVPREILEDVE